MMNYKRLKNEGEDEMYFESTQAIREVLMNRVSSPNYYKYLESNFQGINAELLRLETAKKQTTSREEYDAIEQEIKDLRFLLRNKHDLVECNPPLLTPEEHKSVVSVIEREENIAQKAYNAIQSDFKAEAAKFLKKALVLQEKANAIQNDARIANVGNLNLLKEFYYAKPSINTNGLDKEINYLINATRKVVE